MLNSILVAESLVESCGLSSNSRVLEIGAGLGMLTTRLAERAGSVTSFEIDRSLFEQACLVLSSHSNVRLINADAFEYDLQGQQFDVCVTSLPYSESLRFVKWLALKSPPFKCTSAIVQSEFAEKLRANPGDRSYRAVSVIAQIAFQMEQMFKVGRLEFDPPPKVESVGLRIFPNPKIRQPFFNKKKLKTIDFIFSFRGRKLSSAVRKLGSSDAQKNAISADILAFRVEKISPATYMKLLSEMVKV